MTVVLALAWLAACGGDAKESAAACADVGGTCTAVGSCGVGAGVLAAPSCGAPHLVCCLPLAACPTEDVACQGETYCGRPTCDEGAFVCEDGLTLVSADSCAR